MNEKQFLAKGKKNGLCNRSACLSPNNVTWYNKGSFAYYCPKCAELINKGHKEFTGENYDLCFDEGIGETNQQDKEI